MTDETEKPELLLKWGTLKGWSGFSEGGLPREKMQAYADISGMSCSAMAQENTQTHKEALCDVIDAVCDAGGTIYNDWDGEYMDRDEAKKYVQEYDK